MNTTNEHREKLFADLIDHSTKINQLVVQSKQTSARSIAIERELKQLRAQQVGITQKLHAIEEPNSNIWENIGNGG